MVSIDIVKGNPGALQFLIDAYSKNPFAAEAAFQRMNDYHIVGTMLYMLWNDCCGRDTAKAVQIMQHRPIEEIIEHINMTGGRGIPFEFTKGV